MRQAEVKDYEIIHEYRLLGPGRVEGRQRSCLYLQPQEPNFFAAGGRSVAVCEWLRCMGLQAPGGLPVAAHAPSSPPRLLSTTRADDYTFTMTRVPPPEDAVSMGAVACVLTPKAVTQCV